MVRDWVGLQTTMAGKASTCLEYLLRKPLLVLLTDWLPKAQEQGWVRASVGEQAPLVGASFDKV